MTDLTDIFVKTLPDLALVVRRDGLVLSNLGGRELDMAASAGAICGKTLSDLWPGDVGVALVRLARRALKGRMSSAGRWQYQKTTMDVRVRPQGPDRVLMMIRSSPARVPRGPDGATLNSSELYDPADCSSFAQHFCNSLATARLRESAVALVIVCFDLIDVERANRGVVARMLLSCALERMTLFASEAWSSSKRLPRVAQLESDQLAVLIEEVSSHESMLACVQKMHAALAEPFAVDGRRYELNPTVGVAIYPTDGSTPDGLLDCARAAVLEARRLDCDVTATTHSSMAAAATAARADLEQELRWAVQREQFSLSYVPVLELNGRRTVSVFASLQWLHPISGPVDPERFLPLLDTLDLRTELDRWMLRRGLEDLGHLGHVHEGGERRLNLALKLSKRSFDAAAIVADVTAAASAAGVSASQLDVTIDLKTLAGGGIHERLRELRKLGARIFLEGFGQDGVSLARLPSLPLDGVIIAPAFVARVDVDPLAHKVCSSAAAIARAFGLKSLAFDVCKRTQLDFLYECGCDLVSGPLLADPRQIAPAAVSD